MKRTPNWCSAEKTMKDWLCVGSLLVSVLLCGAEPVARPDQWNLRIAPALDAQVVASVKEGAELVVSGHHGDWCEVPVPPEAEVWVSAVFVNADRTLRSDALLRSGPGVIYPEYRYAALETPVTVEIKERAYEGGWLRIVPLAGLRCYVHRHYTGNPAPRAVPVKSERKEPEKRVRRDRYTITVEGIPVRLKQPIEDAAYELILEINGKRISAGYLVSPHQNLTLWENRMVRISGYPRWVKGVRSPFLEVEKVSPSWK